MDDRWEGKIAVRFRILDLEDEKNVLTNVDVTFELKRPRKLVNFLASAGLPHKLDEDFRITPATWVGKHCLVEVGVGEYENKAGEKKEKNRIDRFLQPEPETSTTENA